MMYRGRFSLNIRDFMDILRIMQKITTIMMPCKVEFQKMIILHNLNPDIKYFEKLTLKMRYFGFYQVKYQ